MMKRKVLGICLAFFALAVWAGVANAAIVNVPNGDFEDWTAPTLGADTGNWSSENLGGGDVNGPGDTGVPDGNTDMWDALRTIDEYWSNDSSFGSGWQSNGPADTDDGNPFDDGKFGLQHPHPANHYASSGSPDYLLSESFNGHFIGFVNMDPETDGADQEIQSATIGNLTPGMTYILKVAVGARPSSSWNDIKYDIMLVSNPTDGDLTDRNFGSSGGTILGTPSTATLVPATAVADGSNIEDLMYMFTATTSDPYAIRIAAHNALTQDGVADDGGGDGSNFRFTQANFDNVRLSCVPEPGSLALLGLAALGMLCFNHRRGA